MEVNIYPNGVKYVGELRTNKYNGQGILTFPNGEKYVGEFKDGKYHGKGILTLPSGEEYVGEFKDGKYHGNGILMLPNGENHIDKFINGKIIPKNDIVKIYYFNLLSNKGLTKENLKGNVKSETKWVTKPSQQQSYITSNFEIESLMSLLSQEPDIDIEMKIFNKTGNIITKDFFDHQKKQLKTTNYLYNDNGYDEVSTFTSLNSNEKNILNLSYKVRYNLNANEIEIFNFEIDGSINEKEVYKYDEKNNLIKIYFCYLQNGDNPSYAVKENINFEYALNKIHKKHFKLGALDNESIYIFDTNKDVEKEKSVVYLKIGLDNIYYTYEYEYDLFNNWIKKYKFKCSNSKFEQKVLEEITERKITYYD